MSYGSVRSFLKEDLHLKPYKIHEVHQLKASDCSKRLEFANWVLSLPIDADKFLDKTKWPPRSPDLNPCDFFLWGYLKARVYSPLPKTLDDLKRNIEREIKKINENLLENVFENFKKRCSLIE